jgi:hypothetical protein
MRNIVVALLACTAVGVLAYSLAPSSAEPGYYETVAQILPVLLLAASLEASILRLLLGHIAASLVLAQYWRTRRDPETGREYMKWLPRRQKWRRRSTAVALIAVVLVSPLALGELAALNVIAKGEEFDALSLDVSALLFAAVAFGFALVVMGGVLSAIAIVETTQLPADE